MFPIASGAFIFLIILVFRRVPGRRSAYIVRNRKCTPSFIFFATTVTRVSSRDRSRRTDYRSPHQLIILLSIFYLAVSPRRRRFLALLRDDGNVRLSLLCSRRVSFSKLHCISNVRRRGRQGERAVTFAEDWLRPTLYADSIVLRTFVSKRCEKI